MGDEFGWTVGDYAFVEMTDGPVVYRLPIVSWSLACVLHLHTARVQWVFPAHSWTHKARLAT